MPGRGAAHVLPVDVDAAGAAVEDADLAGADVGAAGHADVLGHDDPRLAHADVDRAGGGRRPGGRVAQVDDEAADADLVVVAHVGDASGPVLALADAAARVDVAAETTPAGSASASAGRISQRAPPRNAPATSQRPATMTTTATTVPPPDAVAQAPPRASRPLTASRATPRPARRSVSRAPPPGPSPVASHQTCLLVAALLFQIAIPRGSTNDRSPYFAEVIDARPMAAGITANTVYTPEDNVTVIWLDGLDSLPPDYQLQ